MEFQASSTRHDIDSVLAAALDQSTRPACITDAILEVPGPQIVYVNDAYCALMDMPRSDIIGATPRVMQGDLTDRRELDRLKTALQAGESFEGETVNYRSGDRPFIIQWRVDPGRNDEGRITHFAAAQQDVTALRTFEASSRAGRTIEAAARTAIGLADVPGDALAALASGIKEACREVMFGLGRARVSINHPLGPAASSGPEIENGRSLTIPSSRRHVSGEINADLSSAEIKLVPDGALEEVAGWATSALDLVFAALVDRRMVGELEQQWGNRFDAAIDGFEVSYRYEPTFDRMEISGDWLDVVAGGSGPTFIIGDVAGHGVEAVIAMTRISSAIGMILSDQSDVLAAVSRLNRFCFDSGIFTTMLLARWVDESFQLVSAGHLPPIVIEEGRARILDVMNGPPLGAFADTDFSVTHMVIDPGARIALFTDGLIESRGTSLDGRLEVLRDRLEHRSPDLESLADHAMSIGRDESLPDDATLMLLEISRR